MFPSFDAPRFYLCRRMFKGYIYKTETLFTSHLTPWHPTFFGGPVPSTQTYPLPPKNPATLGCHPSKTTLRLCRSFPKGRVPSLTNLNSPGRRFSQEPGTRPVPCGKLLRRLLENTPLHGFPNYSTPSPKALSLALGGAFLPEPIPLRW